VGLPVGQLGVHGLLVRTESLVLTPAQLAAVCAGAVPRGTTVAVPPYLASDGSPPPAEWPADYPAAFVDSVVTGPTQRGLHAGYTWRGGDEADSVPGYYATTKRLRYDVHTPRPGRAPRGLIFGLRDAYGGDTTYEWDALDFLLQRTTDPVGLVTEATYDYRLFKPQLITDANGNRTAIGYTPLGLLAQIANLGRATVSEGDTEEQPGLRFDYDLTAWDRAQQTSSDPQPMSVSTVRRVDHRATIVRREDESRQQAGKPPLTDAEIDALFGPTEETDHPDRFIRTVEYSDGFGRVLQTRTQADQVTVSDLGLPGDFSAAARVLHTDPARNGPTVVVSGWTRYDTKGHAVVIWEPAFDDGYDYRAID
jgi:YD repeat-containing protein